MKMLYSKGDGPRYHPDGVKHGVGTSGAPWRNKRSGFNAMEKEAAKSGKPRSRILRKFHFNSNVEDDLLKISLRGKPSYLWRAGQERRLEMVRRYIPLEGRKILDVGCGIGTCLRAFKRFTNDLYGIEIDKKRAEEAKKITSNISVASAEKLPFDNATFDVVLSHEVLEHVEDDRKAIEEAVRVLKPGGHLVIFVPNRLFPFETHGFYFRGRYLFGNIPLINYLPNRLRNKLAPHVRAYTAGDLKKLFEGLPVHLWRITQIYPGFDKIFARIPFLGSGLRQIFYSLEKTPLKIFGLSHFIIAQKTKEHGIAREEILQMYKFHLRPQVKNAK